MTLQHYLLILHFLRLLKEQGEREQLEPVSKAFVYLLPRQKLLAIINHMTDGGHHPEHPDFSALSNEALLNWIADQYYILDWLIDELEKTIKL